MNNTMNKELLKEYINSQPKKIVEINWEKAKLAYSKIKQCQVRTDAKDEELVRAYLITKLVNELDYKPELIEIEHEYTAGRPRTNTSRIDVVVRDSKGDAFLFIEVKTPEEYNNNQDKTINEQLFKVAGMEKTEGRRVKYLMLYTISFTKNKIKDKCIIIDNENFKTFGEWEKKRDSTDTIPKHYGKTQKTPYVKGSNKDLETDFTYDTLNYLQKDLHNVLWGGGGTDDNDVFSSLTNLILAKIQDEGEKEDGDTYGFQSLTSKKDDEEEFETNEVLFDRINELYRKALREKLNIIDEKELKKSYVVDTKKFSLSKLKYTVQKLEGISFVDGKNSLNGKDILGDFFEGIIRDGFKQTKGQFFTPVNVVRFMLWALKADELAIDKLKHSKNIPYMIDPSAGSGTFLIEYMNFITHTMKYRNRAIPNGKYNQALGTSRDIKNLIDSLFYPDNLENQWAKTYIYGSEINFNLGTATKVNMILHGDGSSNIFIKDGLAPFNEYEKATEYNALNQHDREPLYGDKDINGQFDLILTNPPFSVELDNDTKKIIGNSFLFGDKKNSENLFIERWYQLLRENGRCAAVLPESVFDTTENKYIRLFIYKYFKVKAVISLPQLTFEPFTSTKTSILFMQKKTNKELEEWNKAWQQASSKYSLLKTRVQNIIDVFKGLKQKNDLPSIKDLTDEEEKQIIFEMLKIEDKDAANLSVDRIVYNYEDELENLCKTDFDTADTFGYVNTWWVFNEVIVDFDYEIFMAEADNIGYKRTKRGERPMPNDLFRTDEDNHVLVDDGVETTILDYMRKLKWN